MHGQGIDEGVLSVELKTFVAFVSRFVELDGLVTTGQIKVPSPTTERRARVDETLRREHLPPHEWPAEVKSRRCHRRSLLGSR